MESTDSKDLARAGIGLGFVVASSTFLGPLGGIIAGIGGNLISTALENRLDDIYAKSLRLGGIKNDDIRQCFIRSYTRTLTSLEKQWTSFPRSATALRSKQEDASHADLFALLQSDIQGIFNERGFVSLSDLIRTEETFETVELRARQQIDSYIEMIGYGHSDQLKLFLNRNMIPVLREHLIEDLMTDRPANNRAWRSLELGFYSDMREAVDSFQQGESKFIGLTEDLGEAIERLDAHIRHLTTLNPEVRDTTTRVVLQTLFDQARVERENATDTIRELIRSEGELSRRAISGEIQVTVAQLSQQLDTANGRVEPDADTLLLGPVRALKLQDQLDAANREMDRTDAARLYGTIADRLAAKGHWFASGEIRSLQAQAFTDSGAHEDAYRVWIDDVRESLDRGYSQPPFRSLAKLADSQALVSLHLAARGKALLAREAWFEDPVGAIKDLQESLSILTQTCDEWGPLVACWLGELAFTHSTLTEAGGRAVCRQISEHIGNAVEDIRIRLEVTLAEQTGDWAPLLEQTAPGELPVQEAGLIHSRYGRWCALKGDGRTAIRSYNSAIEKLAQARLLGDASGALQSRSLLRQRYSHAIGQAVEDYQRSMVTADGTTRFAGGRRARGSALHELHRNRLPDALKELSLYLLSARLAGNLTSELEARELLGDVYSTAGYVQKAAENYILAGADKKAGDLAKHHNGLYVEEQLGSSAPWIVGSALAVIAEQGDTIPVEVVERMSPRIIELMDEPAWSMIRPIVMVEAWRAVTSVSLQLNAESIDKVISHLDKLVTADAQLHPHIDQSVAALLLEFHYFFPEARPRVSIILSRALDNEGIRQYLHGRLTEAITTDPGLLMRAEDKASAGDRLALDALTDAGIQHPALQMEAERRAEGILEYQVGLERNTVAVSNRFEDAAAMAGHLAPARKEAMVQRFVDICLDAQSPEHYRASAATALEILVGMISDEYRTIAFESLLPLIHLDSSRHPIDEWAVASQDPLSRFRIQLLSTPLSVAVLAVVSRLAVTDENVQTLRRAILQAGVSAEFGGTGLPLDVISRLDPAIRPDTRLDWLALSSSPKGRQMAVILWTNTPSPDAEIGGALALDGDRRVRMELAARLDQIKKTAPVIADELARQLSQDPSANVRALARRHLMVINVASDHHEQETR